MEEQPAAAEQEVQPAAALSPVPAATPVVQAVAAVEEAAAVKEQPAEPMEVEGAAAAEPLPAPAAEAAPAEGVQPTTARKRVRFAGPEGTPEGALRDVTMTIHVRKGDLRQVGWVGAGLLGRGTCAWGCTLLVVLAPQMVTCARCRLRGRALQTALWLAGGSALYSNFRRACKGVAHYGACHRALGGYFKPANC